jgi:L-lysine exporter family protein LysE/ArgO
MQALITGLLTGLSLIVAIGAQNAYVLRQGLARKHVLAIVLLCAFSDALLITLGVLGLGQVIQAAPLLLEIIRWFGVGYLIWFGIGSLRRVFKAEKLEASDKQVGSLKSAMLTTLSLTFLNPHVYLDTVIFVGGLAHQFGNQTVFFTSGAILASFIWFFGLGFGASRLSPLMSKPVFWKILDSFIAVIMFSIAIALAIVKFN